MSKKKEIFSLIDRDCVSPVSSEAIKKYINGLILRIEQIKTIKGEM